MKKLHLTVEEQNKLVVSTDQVLSDDYSHLVEKLFVMAETLIEGDRLFALKSRIGDIQTEIWNEIHNEGIRNMRSCFICKSREDKDTETFQYSKEEYTEGTQCFKVRMHTSVDMELGKLLRRLRNLFKMIFLNDKQQNSIFQELRSIIEPMGNIMAKKIRGVTSSALERGDSATQVQDLPTSEPYSGCCG